MSRKRRVRTKSEVVRQVPWAKPPVTSDFPGHDGPRPQLSFVLKTLAGDDSGMTEMHLSISNARQLFKEAWGKVFADPQSTHIAKNSMVATMRYLADLWIDSGKRGEGENVVNNPSRRNVEYRPPVGTPSIVLKIPSKTFLSVWNPSEINQKSSEHPRSFELISLDGDLAISEVDSLYEETPVYGWNAFSISGNQPISVLFYELIGDEARWPQIHKDGTQSLKELVFGFNLENFNSSYRLALHRFGMRVAMYWFARLLDSPFSHLLARCDDCRTYFAYERAPRTDIKGGTHCRNCAKCGSSKRMKSTRDKRTVEMVRFAGDALALWKPNSRHGSRSKWVAEQVNRRTAKIRAKSGRESGSHFPKVTGRWVTQHQTKIEAEAERRNHAKG